MTQTAFPPRHFEPKTKTKKKKKNYFHKIPQHKINGSVKVHISLKIDTVLDNGIPSRHKAKKLHYLDGILQSTHIKHEAKSNTEYNSFKLT